MDETHVSFALALPSHRRDRSRHSGTRATPRNILKGIQATQAIIDRGKSESGLYAQLDHGRNDCPVGTLRGGVKEDPIPETDLHDVEQAANELFDLIRSTEMPAKLKKFLLELVEKVRQAIAQYWIYGAKGLTAALASLTGGFILKKPELDQVKEKHAILKQLGKLWTGLANIARITKDVRDIGAMAQTAIPGIVLFLDSLKDQM